MENGNGKYPTWQKVAIWAVSLLVMLMGAVVADTRASLERKVDKSEIQEFKQEIRDFMKEMRALHTKP